MAAATACSAASPLPAVSLTSTRCPFSRTHPTRCWKSVREARAPCTMITMCFGYRSRMATNWSSAYHAPVLADEVLTFVGDARTALDGTLGGGGHTLAMLEHGVREVVGIDRDPMALETARERLAAYEKEG